MLFRPLILALLVTACGQDTTEPGQQTVDVRLGSALTIPGDTTTVRFTDVTSDSRCPTGVQCVWAGEAVTVFTVGSTETYTLTLGADAQKASAIAHGYTMKIVGLKPYPTSAGPINKADYVATLKITSAKD